MSDFCIVFTARSGSYYLLEYMCRTFDLVEGNNWFGRNIQSNLEQQFKLNHEKLDIDYSVNEDLLSDLDIKNRLKHLENFPFPFCIKATPREFTNTIESNNFSIKKKIQVARKILDNFDLIWFVNENKISHFCYELTCSRRGRAYSTYIPELRITPPANSFTASKKDFDKFVKREEFINSVMWGYNIPIVTHDNFVKDQDSELKRIAEFYGIKGNFLEENKKPVMLNPDYTKIFTNYREIEKWFTQYQK